MNVELWKLIASIGGLLVTVVTAPFLWAIRAESRAIRKEIELVRAETKLEISASEARLTALLTALETRLNERFADKLNDHGERIIRLEERRFRG